MAGFMKGCTEFGAESFWCLHLLVFWKAERKGEGLLAEKIEEEKSLPKGWGSFWLEEPDNKAELEVQILISDF